MTPRLRIVALAGAALAVAPVATLGARAAPKGHAAKPKAAAIYTVTIKDMKFGPPPRIHVGDTIEWSNQDIFVHSATAKNGAFDAELKPGAHLWTTFLKAGTYAFTCRYHPGMTGTLVVKDQGR